MTNGIEFKTPCKVQHLHQSLHLLLCGVGARTELLSFELLSGTCDVSCIDRGEERMIWMLRWIWCKLCHLERMCALPCHELLLGRPFSQTSEMCLASGILSLQEWDRPLDLQTKEQRNSQWRSLNAVTEIKRVMYEENKWQRRCVDHSYEAVHFNVNSLLLKIEIITVCCILLAHN